VYKVIQFLANKLSSWRTPCSWTWCSAVWNKYPRSQYSACYLPSEPKGSLIYLIKYLNI